MTKDFRESGRSGWRRAGDGHWAGEPVRVLEVRWGVPRLEVHGELSSTNDRLRELAGRGSPPFTVVVAEEQTAGRGRGGSRWISPPGMGIWMSVLLPRERSGRPPLTPLLVGLAVTRALHDRFPAVTAGIKWPNDVVLEGRKVCGILCEGGVEGGTVAGVGINVLGGRDRLPPALRDRATTVEASSGERVSRPELAGAVLRGLRELADPPPDELSGELLRELEGLDVLRGRKVVTSGGTVGRAVGIDRAGALLLDPGREEGPKRIVAGSVRQLSEE